MKKSGGNWFAGIKRNVVERIDWSIPLVTRKMALRSAQQEAYEKNNARPKLVETCTGDRLVAPQ